MILDDGGDHHIQEIIPVCLRLGRSVTPVELFPSLQSPVWGDLVVIRSVPGGTLKGNWDYFSSLVATERGVITGNSQKYGHAVAFCRNRIYDPDGWCYAYGPDECAAFGFYSKCLWIIR